MCATLAHVCEFSTCLPLCRHLLICSMVAKNDCNQPLDGSNLGGSAVEVYLFNNFIFMMQTCFPLHCNAHHASNQWPSVLDDCNQPLDGSSLGSVLQQMCDWCLEQKKTLGNVPTTFFFSVRGSGF